MSGGVTNERCMKALRALGYICDVVERRLPIPDAPPAARRTVDCFGFFDILAFRGPGCADGNPSFACALLVQTTAGSCVSARRAKVEANEDARWIAERQQAYIEVWGFRRRLVKRRGSKWKMCRPCKTTGYAKDDTKCKRCGGFGRRLRHDPTKKRAFRWVYSRQRWDGATWVDIPDGVAVPLRAVATAK